uniref:Uncharacterized protein n=1 Tax=Arundo donax TaxID=35708 RepID=A0A0A9EM74_ARUDO
MPCLSMCPFLHCSVSLLSKYANPATLWIWLSQ